MLIRHHGIERQQWALGSALALLAYALLACQDAVVKSLVSEFSVWQILCVRSGFIVAACLMAGGPGLLRKVGESRAKGLLAARGAFSLAAWLCYFTAAKTMPLPQLTTLYFAAPIIVVILAVPLLGERVERWGWIGVGLGFCGTVAACDPMGWAISPAAMLVLVGATFWAVGVLIMRQIGRREVSLVQLFSNNLLFFLATCLGSLGVWETPDGVQLIAMICMGVLGGLGQFCLIEATRLAPISLTAPLQYSGLLWSFSFGFVFWGFVPGLGVSIGAIFILAAGVVVLSGARQGPIPQP